MPLWCKMFSTFFQRSAVWPWSLTTWPSKSIEVIYSFTTFKQRGKKNIDRSTDSCKSICPLFQRGIKSFMGYSNKQCINVEHHIMMSTYSVSTFRSPSNFKVMAAFIHLHYVWQHHFTSKNLFLINIKF